MTVLGELAFLGEEFLTWLWFKSETGAGTFQAQDGTEIGVTLDDFLALGGEEDAPEQILRRGLPTRSPEATVSLKSGKRVLRARLILASGGEQWGLTLDGHRFAFGAVRTERSEDPDEIVEARDLARMESFARIAELIDELYRIFLGERVRPQFQRETLQAMRGWVRARDTTLPAG